MSAPEPITSLQNPRVKHVCTLQAKVQERRRTGTFVVEGRRELERCAAAGYSLKTLFVCPEIAGDEAWPAAQETLLVAPAVYAKMAYRGTTEGLLAVVQAQPLTLEGLTLGERPLLVVVESVEKPGNLGAVLRSADAAGATAVIVCDPRCDLDNPNLIRSSVGTRFTVPCAACTTAECIAFLRAHGVRILTAQLQDSAPYYAEAMTGATALVMGTESTGLTEAWRVAADAHVRIPMLGVADSLNVSVSAAILLFEAVRQRRQAEDGNALYLHASRTS